MALFGRKKTTVGLDIGSGLVKVAVVPLLADAIVEGEVMDPGIVAEAIQSALAAADVKGKQVVTAVGGRDVIIKRIQIERVKEQQARELMRWEAEQHAHAAPREHRPSSGHDHVDRDDVERERQTFNPHPRIRRIEWDRGGFR